MELRGVGVGQRRRPASSEQRVPKGVDERQQPAFGRQTAGWPGWRAGTGVEPAARVLEADQRGHVLGVHDKRGADRQIGVAGRARSGPRQLRAWLPFAFRSTFRNLPLNSDASPALADRRQIITRMAVDSLRFPFKDLNAAPGQATRSPRDLLPGPPLRSRCRRQALRTSSFLRQRSLNWELLGKLVETGLGFTTPSGYIRFFLLVLDLRV